MSTSNTSVVISAETQQAIDAINKFNTKLKELTTNSGDAGAKLREASTTTDFFKGKMEDLARMAAGVFAVDRIVAFGGAIKDATLDLEKSTTLLNGALASTGHSAGITREELDKMAQTLSKKTTFDDDGIKKAEAALLRFRDVQGSTFKSAVLLSADLATALGTDLVSAAQSIGKALESPETGMRGLKAAGVSLTEQQIDLAKKLRETGDYAGAQKIVIDALSKSVGGQAVAANVELTKSTSDVSKSWDNFLKSVGQSPVGGGTIVYLDNMTAALDKLKIVVDGSWTDRLAVITGTAVSHLPLIGPYLGTALLAADESDRANRPKTGQQIKDAQNEEALAAAGEAKRKQEQQDEAAYERQKKAREQAQAQAKRDAEVFAAFMKNLRGETAGREADLGNLQGGGQISAVGRKYAAWLSDITNGSLKLSNTDISKAAIQWDKLIRADDAVMEEEKAKKAAEGAKRAGEILEGLKGRYAEQNDKAREKMQVLPESQKQLMDSLRQVDEEARHAREELAKMNDISPEELAKRLADANTQLVTQRKNVMDLNHQQDLLNGRWEYGANKALTSYLDEIRNVSKDSEVLFSDALHGMDDALLNFTDHGKLSFSALGDSIVHNINRMALHAMETRFFDMLAGNMGGSNSYGYAVGVIGNLLGGTQKAAPMTDLSKPFTGFAKGDVFTSPDLSQHLNTVLSSPTLFRFAKGGAFGVGGESGPEAVMPLKRDAAGRLGVAANGGAQRPIMITINQSIPGSVDTRTHGQIAASAGLGVRRALARNT